MDTIAAVLLGALLTTAGIGHFVAPGYFRTLLPSWMPAPRLVVAFSGIADVTAGVLTLVPAARSRGAWMAAGLISVYMTSHLDALRGASRTNRRWLDRPAGVAARIVVNLAYLVWAVGVAVAFA